MVHADRTVAIALLTQKQLKGIGRGLKKVIPITDDDRFEKLLRALDELDTGASGNVA